MLQTSHSMVPSVCCTTEHACNCTSIGLHLRRSAAAISMPVTGAKANHAIHYPLFMAVFPSSDWWRSFSSTNSWCKEFNSLLQQDTRNKSRLSVGFVIWCHARNSCLEHNFTAMANCEKIPPLQLLWNIQPLQTH